MKWSMLMGAGLAMTAAGIVLASPVDPFEPDKGFRAMALAPFQMQTQPLVCRAKERTCIIVYGQGTAPMGLYVYDAYGNCVARDDVSTGDVFDDLAAEWHPPVQGEYDIVVRNLGRKANIAEVAIR